MRKISLLLCIAVMVLAMAACAKKVIEEQSEVEMPPPVEETAEVDVVEPAIEEPVVDVEQEQRDKKAELQQLLNKLVYFDFDQSALRNEAIASLQDKIQWFKENPDMATFIIEGHCDERGTDAYNLALGSRRADAVKQYLVETGLPADMFQTYSYGEERPLDEGHYEEAWAKNRRAAIVINGQ
jgi:peptidoglycan-associated lipoprotein